VSIQIVELSTDEPEVAHEVLNELYGAEHPFEISGDPTNFSCRLHLASAPTVGTDHVRHSMAARVSMAPTDFLLVGSILGGSYDEFNTEREQRRLRRGDVALYPADEELETAWSDIDLTLIRLPFEVVDRVAAERLGITGKVRFEGMLPVSEARRRAWRRLSSYVRGQVGIEGSVLDQPLIETRLAELIAALALVTFPNATMRIDHAPRRQNAAPAAVRRAVAFIEANAERPISVSDVAVAARVGPRALRYGFTRHLETTPSAYLRRTRLRRAHEELLTADAPPTADAIEATAHRWGFLDGPRFSAAYRELYGRPPGGDGRPRGGGEGIG
jgi:AraC-like DNA-binding protein